MTHTQSTKNKIPMLGFGTFQITGEDCYNAVLNALKVGYRHIDTAHAYGNHEEVGKALKDSGIPREEIFLTSKVGIKEKDPFKSSLSYSDLMAEAKETFSQLDVDYLDLYLIHWPSKDVSMEETFKALDELYDSGKIKAYGVSNFTINHIKDASKFAKQPIVANQVEFHPFLYQKDLLEFCNEKNIAIEAYSPLARGEIFKNDVLKEIADAKGIKVSQLVLAWIISKDVIAIPKSVKLERIEENFQIEGIKLTDEEVSKIDSLNKDMRTISPPWNEYDY